MSDDIETRWASLKDDVIRFSGHVMPVPRMAFLGPDDADSVVGRVRYRDGNDGPVVWIDSKLRRPDQLRVLEAAWQAMIQGVPDHDRVREPDGYWHVDITWDE